MLQIVKFRTIDIKNDFLDKRWNMFLFSKIEMVSYYIIVCKK